VSAFVLDISVSYIVCDCHVAGVIVTKKPLDREAESEHHLTVVAQDGGGLQCRSTVHVTLTDVNDCPPRFVPHSHYAGSVAEDAAIGTPILRVAAIDPDVGTSRRVRYSMEPPHVGVLFGIDAVSGVITLLQSLDREHQATYNLTVSASDQVGFQRAYLHWNLLIKVIELSLLVYRSTADCCIQ